MEPEFKLDGNKVEDFLKKYFTNAMQLERQKEYNQMLFEAKIYDLNPFNKMKLLLNVGNNILFLWENK